MKLVKKNTSMTVSYFSGSGRLDFKCSIELVSFAAIPYQGCSLMGCVVYLLVFILYFSFVLYAPVI